MVGVAEAAPIGEIRKEEADSAGHSLAVAALFVALVVVVGAVGWLRRAVGRRTLLLRDHVQRLRASEAAHARTTRILQASREAVPEGVLVTGMDGTFLHANSKVGTILEADVELDPESPDSAPQLAIALATAFESPEAFARFWWGLLDTRVGFADRNWTLAGGANRVVNVASSVIKGTGSEPLGRIWIFRDLSLRRTLQRELTQAQKMEAVGQLAGGIAHDFNNLLTGISGNLAVARLRQGIPVREIDAHLAAAESASRRAARVVGELLGFSRQNPHRYAVGDANAVVTRLVDLFRHSTDAGLDIVLRLEADLWPARLDGIHIEQVILNMCVNARDAMEEGDRIVISTHNSRVRRDATTPECDAVEIRVSDTGCGMAEEVRQRIFDPFFTTKPQGEGTGLGLSMAHDLIEQHGGWISCDSYPGEGTTFRVFLPRTFEPASTEDQVTSVDPAPPSDEQLLDTTGRKRSGSGEAILVVDDEAVVRQVTESLLVHRGHPVATAEHGEEAIGMLREDAYRFDLVILDLTMPVCSGKETLRAIREIRPDLPVVLCSGYMVDLDAFAAEAGSRPDGFLQKPFDARGLYEVTSQLLEVALPS
ncbi:hypothetical protein BH23VER1_BH23VER1_09660 [soil metagenome]